MFIFVEKQVIFPTYLLKLADQATREEKATFQDIVHEAILLISPTQFASININLTTRLHVEVFSENVHHSIIIVPSVGIALRAADIVRNGFDSSQTIAVASFPDGLTYAVVGHFGTSGTGNGIGVHQPPIPTIHDHGKFVIFFI